MSRIPEEDVRRVREASDLLAIVAETVVLKQRGREFWGCCPFHHEKTPSFKVDPDTQLWHCFGCGKGGDVFGYLMESEHYEFPEAVRVLADRAHIEIHEEGGVGVPRGKKDRMMQACKEAEDFYHLQLMRSRETGPAQARAYLGKRGFGTSPSNEWMLGYAPGHGKLVQHLRSKGFTRDEILEADLAHVNKQGHLVDRFYERVMFPIHDLQGRTIAFGGRVIGSGEPKYLNTKTTPLFDKSSNMFGIEKVKSAIVASGQAIVVEGYTDVIALHEAGIKNVVATLGTALTATHVKMLNRFARQVVYLFDGDSAGQKAADRASEFISWESAVESRRDPIDLRVVVLPDNSDPAEYVAAHSADELREVIASSEPLLRFSIDRCLSRYDLRKPEQKMRAMEQALKIVYPIRSSVSATDYINLIADRLNVEYTAVAKVLKEMKAPMAARHQEDEAHSEPDDRQTTGAAAHIMKADQQLVSMERELISLLVTSMRLLDYVEKDLVRISWADEDCEKMIDTLMGLEHDATPAHALMSVSEVVPQAPSLLAGAMSDAEGEDERVYRARLLVKLLREKTIEREIRSTKARLQGETGLSSEDFDALFEKAVALQKELVALRNEREESK